MTSPPSGAAALMKKIGPGWTVVLHGHASGELDFGGFSEEPDAGGTRRRISTVEPVESYLVRCEHADGRQVVAVWLSRILKPSKSGKPSWTLDMAWRSRHDDEFTPSRLTAAELNAYVAEANAEDALNAIQFYHEEQGAKRRKKKS